MPELRPAFPLADARNDIIEAAIALFAERGFHGATMRDIAERAGVSQGLLHHHFQGKEGLWNVVGERISADFLTYMAEAADPVSVDAKTIPAAVRRYMTYWKEHPAAFRFNLWRLLEGPGGERKSRSEALNRRAVPLFKRAQDAGFIRDDMPAGLAMCMAGGLVQFWLHSQTEIRDALAVTGDPPLADEVFLDHLFRLICPTPTKANRRAPARRTRR